MRAGSGAVRAAVTVRTLGVGAGGDDAVQAFGRVLGVVNGIGERGQTAFFLPLGEQLLVARARRRQCANRHAESGGLVALLGAIGGEQRVLAAHAGE